MRTLAKIWIATCCCVALALAGCGDPGDGGASGSGDSDGGFGLGSCEPGETKQVDCNSCMCDDDGSWACTAMACADADAGSDTGSPDADIGSLDAGASDAGSPDGDAGGDVGCQDGDEKQVDCNTCYCQDGTWACTEMACGDAGNGDYEPCGDKACGETCTVCSPNDPTCTETDVVKYCQPDGSCSATEPSCGDDDECQSDRDCVVSGCSGQVCADEPQATTCEWREEYACYQEYGDCGCNEGSCGWAQTDDLVQCLGE
ncbi:MAG: hypothetical protein ACOC9J_05145 [Persicimonas sp.]